MPKLIPKFLTSAPSGREPHRLLRPAYLATAATSVVAAAIPHDATTRLVKPALMPLLAASSTLFATRQNREAAKSQPLDTALLLAGLAGGCLGDIILMGKNSRSEDHTVRARNLNQGAAAFAVNQLAYHALFLRSGAKFRQSNVMLHLPAVIGGAGLALWKNRPALPAAVGYGSALATTSILAQDAGCQAGTGGLLFVVSDGLILARMALLKQKSSVDALVDGAVMGTYVVAQMLLVDHLSQHILDRGRG